MNRCLSNFQINYITKIYIYKLLGLIRKQGGLRDSLRVAKERLKDLKAKD